MSGDKVLCDAMRDVFGCHCDDSHCFLLVMLSIYIFCLLSASCCTVS